ncbi:MAG: hypothetical protein ACYC99_04290 [Candidatus Geothermincolia bacterium]
MRIVKVLLLLVIVGSTAVTGFTLTKVIGVQRSMGESQTALLAGVDRQNTSIVDISGSFKPTEEMVGKTKEMLGDLKELTGVVSEMNGLVANANKLQGTTAIRLDESNGGMAGLRQALESAGPPLTLVGSRTAVTLDFVTKTVAALRSMAAGLSGTNSSAADIANMLEGKY